MRILLRLLGIIFVILLLFVAALFIIPTERIARIATDQFTAATGRALTISGDVRPTLYPVLGVRTDGVELANADWSQTGPMLTADRLSVGVQLMPLLSGHLEVEEIVVEGARVSLERNVDGQSNWVFETASSEVDSSANGLTPPSAGLPRISLARGALSDTSVEFRDDSTGVLISLTGLTIDMALDGANGAATLAGSGILNGQTVRLDIDTGDINALLAGQVERVSLKSQLVDIKFDFEGRAGLSPFTLDGQTTLNVPQLTPVFALLGQAAPALPGGAGSRPRVFRSGHHDPGRCRPRFHARKRGKGGRQLGRAGFRYRTGRAAHARRARFGRGSRSQCVYRGWAICKLHNDDFGPHFFGVADQFH